MKHITELNESSVKRYKTIFNSYAKILEITSIDDWLEYVNNRNLSASSVRVLYTSILHFHKELNLDEKKDEEVTKRMREELNKVIKKEKEARSNQIEIDKTYEDLKPMIKLKTRDRIIYNIYTKQAPRRNQDYQNMYVWKRKGKPRDTKKNYYLRNKGYFVFNSYKTQKVYGQQIVKVNEELNTLLKEFTKNKKNNESLLNMKQANLSLRIRKIFGISLNEIRHLYVDHLFKENPNRSTDEMKELSKQLGHSIETHLNYRTKAVCKDKVEEPKVEVAN